LDGGGRGGGGGGGAEVRNVIVALTYGNEHILY